MIDAYKTHCFACYGMGEAEGVCVKVEPIAGGAIKHIASDGAA